MFGKVKSSFDMIEKYKTIALYEKNDETRFSRDKIILYGLCGVAAAVLTVLNFIDHSFPMFYITLVLTLGMFAGALSIKFSKYYLIGDIIVSIVVGITFSYFAISGANNGFAILWILVLPPIMVTFSRQTGLFVSIYFLVFVFAICYTPLKQFVVDYYTPTFLERFPLLCLTNFLIIYYIWLKGINNERTLAIRTYVDELTGIFNRQFYRIVSDSINEKKLANKVVMVSLDVNGLKRTNDISGHLAGDELIKGAAEIIRDVFNANSYGVFRIGGDEFVAIVKCDRSDIPTYERKLVEAQKKWVGKLNKEISLSYGFAAGMDYPDKNIEFVYNAADEMMLANKTKYYVTNKIDRRHNERRGNDRRVTDLING